MSAKYDNIGGAVRGGRQILGMALDAIRGGDEAAAAVKPAKSVARKALDEIADDADDWGWKGGKPGEITGTDYTKVIRNIDRSSWDDPVATPEDIRKYALPKDVDILLDDYFSGERRHKDAFILSQKAKKQFLKSNNQFIRNFENNELGDESYLLSNFATLEEAGVPREWTAKVLESIVKADPYSTWVDKSFTQNISDALRKMYIKGDPETTRAHRETFLALLPEWSGTLDDLANAARTL